jgi:FkbM family methyltransferase
MPLHLRALTGVQRAVSRAASAVGRDSRAVRALSPLYERALRALTGDAGIPWTINGEAFRIDPRYRARLGPSYESRVADYLRARVRPGDVSLDIGANVGAYVLQLTRWSAPQGRVVAFEPNPAAADVLRRHVRMNHVESAVTIVAAAAGAEADEGVLHASGADGMSRLAIENPLLRGRTVPVRVPVVTLDGYCRAHRLAPSWLVIDVEGAEGDVLRGASGLIASGTLRGVVAEFHPDSWPAAGADAMRRLLGDMRLCATPLTSQRDALAEHGAVALEPLSP